MKNILKISHTILYAKGWYKRNNKRYDINVYSICWQDIIKTLSADGYYPTTKYDCLRIINRIIHDSDIDKDSNLEFLSKISCKGCSSYGYYTKEYLYVSEKYVNLLPEYNQEDSVMFYYLKILSRLESTQWVIKAPKKGVLPFKPCKGREKGWLLNRFSEVMPQYKEVFEKNTNNILVDKNK